MNSLSLLLVSRDLKVSRDAWPTQGQREERDVSLVYVCGCVHVKYYFHKYAYTYKSIFSVRVPLTVYFCLLIQSEVCIFVFKRFKRIYAHICVPVMASWDWAKYRSPVRFMASQEIAYWKSPSKPNNRKTQFPGRALFRSLLNPQWKSPKWRRSDVLFLHLEEWWPPVPFNEPRSGVG